MKRRTSSYADKLTRMKQRPPRTPQASFTSRQDSNWVSRIRQSLGLSRKVFSRLIGFSERAIAGWENGTPVSGPSQRRLREIARFQQQLARVVKSKDIPN